MSILTDMSAAYMRVRLARTGLSFSKSDKEGRRSLAASRGADEKAYRVTKLLLPKGYDAEFQAVKKTLGLIYAHYIKHTMPYGQGADGSAEGDRLLAAATNFSQTWLVGLSQMSKQLDAEREALAVALPQRIAEIQADGILGSDFDPAAYPSPDDIRASFTFKLEGPEPLSNHDNYKSLPLDEKLAAALQKRQEARTAERVAFGQQSIANDALGFVRTMADNLKRLAEHMEQDGSGKSPRIYDSLTENLKHAVGIMRTYALDSTEQGRAVKALAERIEQELVPASRKAADFRDNATLARVTAEKAATLAEEIEDMEVLF